MLEDALTRLAEHKPFDMPGHPAALMLKMTSGHVYLAWRNRNSMVETKAMFQGTPDAAEQDDAKVLAEHFLV
jgi:hypothetical protein